MAEKKKSGGLVYRGKPLIRCGNVLYYGSMADSHIVMLQIRETEKDHGLDVASKVMVTLMQTDESLNILQRVVRTGEKNGLYEAIEIGDIWLSRALADNS